MMPEFEPQPRQTLSLLLAAWVLSLAFDFFLHGGLLAGLYVRESSFLLDPATAFRRIPVGYLAFLLLTGGLLWLFGRLDVRGWLDGLRLGLGIGLFVWGAVALGLWSITTAGPDVLTGWWVGQGFELGLAGAVLGSGRAGVPLRSIWLKVGVATVLLAAATVLLQSLGLAPAVRL